MLGAIKSSNAQIFRRVSRGAKLRGSERGMKRYARSRLVVSSCLQRDRIHSANEKIKTDNSGTEGMTYIGDIKIVSGQSTGV